MAWWVRALLVYAGLLVGATTAAAQTDQPGVSILERSRPVYDQLGERMGSFLLLPKLDVQESYNSNIFATQTNRKPDFISEVLPTAELRSDWNNNLIRILGAGDIARNLNSPHEDYEDFTLAADGRLDVTRDDQVFINAAQLRAHEPRGTPEDIAGITPTIYDVTSADLGAADRMGRVSTRISGSFVRYAYENNSTGTAIIDNSGRTRNQYQGTAQIGFELVPGYQPFVRASYNKVAYDLPTDPNGYRRNSDGYNLAIGTAIDLTHLIKGEVFAGYLSQTYVDPRLARQSGVSFGGSLLWTVTALTSVRAGVTRSTEETILAGSSGYIATSFSLGVEHELLRNLIPYLRVAYVNSDYSGIGRDDNLMAASIGISYLINRYFHVGGEITHQFRDSNVAGSDFDVDIVRLRLSARF